MARAIVHFLSLSQQCEDTEETKKHEPQPGKSPTTRLTLSLSSAELRRGIWWPGLLLSLCLQQHTDVIFCNPASFQVSVEILFVSAIIKYETAILEVDY